MFPKSSALVFPTLFLSVAASLAQTGFTSKTYPANDASELLTADFNHDGKPDLFGYNPNGIASIYFNDGSGGFKAGVVLPPAEGTLTRAKIVDLNGDGSPDIVACDVAMSRNGTFSYLVTYLNDGSGRFTQTQVVNLANGCSSIVVGDVNLDGRQDVVIAGGNNSFSTFYGDGTGKVSTTPIVVKGVNLDSKRSGSYSTNCIVDDIIGGNFYLDGQLSLMVNSYCRPPGTVPGNFGTTFLAHGHGNGQFTFTESHEGTDQFVEKGQTVDINQDGRPDALFLANHGNGNRNLYAINNGGGNFTYLSPDDVIYNDGGPPPTTFYGGAVGDLTGDGLNDLAIVYPTYTQTYRGNPTYIAILAGLKGGGFTESQRFQLEPNANTVSQVVTADFNGDGKLDLAVIATDNVSTGSASTLHVYLSSAPGNNCLPSSAGVSICAPASGSTSASPVTIRAGALAQSGNITAIRAYIDQVAVFTTNNATASKSQQVSQSVAVAPGSHKLVVVGYESTGASLSSTEMFTVGGSAACYPASAGVKICSPAQNATTSSPVTIVAGATAANGYITAIRVYVDSKATTLVNNPQQSKSFTINTPVTIAAGKHSIVVVGYQSTGGWVNASDTVTVQ